jgi:hypothetical protein
MVYWPGCPGRGRGFGYGGPCGRGGGPLLGSVVLDMSKYGIEGSWDAWKGAARCVGLYS